MYLDDVSSCAELTEAHAEEAARSAASLRGFLRWASETARPEEGAPKVLRALARLVDADWLEGTPYAEVRGDDTSTTLSIFCDHGVGIRERIVPLVRLSVPFDEFVRAVRLAPHLVRPLRPTFKADALSLSPSDAPAEHEPATGVRRNTIAIDLSSLTGAARSPFERQHRPVTPAPPHVAEKGSIHTRPTPLMVVAVDRAFLSRNGY